MPLVPGVAAARTLARAKRQKPLGPTWQKQATRPLTLPITPIRLGRKPSSSALTGVPNALYLVEGKNIHL